MPPAKGEADTGNGLPEKTITTTLIAKMEIRVDSVPTYPPNYLVIRQQRLFETHNPDMLSLQVLCLDKSAYCFPVHLLLLPLKEKFTNSQRILHINPFSSLI